MQACSLAGGDSLGSHGPPLVLASPGTKAKLLLLERRLTGSSPGHHSTHATEANSAQLTTANQNQMLADALVTAAEPAEVVVIDDTQEDGQAEPLVRAPTVPAAQQAPPAATPLAAARESRKSPTPPVTDMPASASKRRKTGKPQHRPADAATPPAASAAVDGSKAGTMSSFATAAGTASGGKDLVQQRDKASRTRASPHAAPTPAAPDMKAPAAAAGAAGDPGNSNPPMSPMSGGAGEHKGTGVLWRQLCLGGVLFYARLL